MQVDISGEITSMSIAANDALVREDERGRNAERERHFKLMTVGIQYNN